MKNKAAQALAAKSVAKRFGGMSIEQKSAYMSAIRKGKKKRKKLFTPQS